jgi:pimeloyl-ACP methyl ester carboxylesterase
MTKAGVRPTDEVMLVGHSEGGMVAVTAAREAVRSKRFNVTHVVTAGSPISTDLKSLPKTVQVLALENHSDVVPQADGSTNPDQRNVTTVTGDVNDNSITDNHSIEDSYEHIADQADHSDNASIRHFLASASGFLTGCGQNVQRFVIHRKYF